MKYFLVRNLNTACPTIWQSSPVKDDLMHFKRLMEESGYGGIFEIIREDELKFYKKQFLKENWAEHFRP